jgi:site-specific recombinase XerD
MRNTFQAAVTDFQLSRDLTPKSRQWYSDVLRAFAVYAESEGASCVEDVTLALLRRYTRYLQDRTTRYGRKMSSATVVGTLTGVRSFINFSVLEYGVQVDVKRWERPKKEEKTVKTIGHDDIERLFLACKDDRFPVLECRDKAILALFLDAGLRSSELSGLTLDRVFLDDVEDLHLLIKGKGRREREVGLGSRSARELRRYLRRREAPRDFPYVFVSRQGNQLNVNTLSKLLHRLQRKAGLESVPMHIHSLRHSFAKMALEKGVGVFDVSLLLGHSRVETTSLYLKDYKSRDARKRLGGVL